MRDPARPLSLGIVLQVSDYCRICHNRVITDQHDEIGIIGIHN
jgi:hypothetical protein